jgi:hypothetical protein
MWKSKKFIIAIASAFAILAASLGGVALANDHSGEESEAATRLEIMLDKVSANYFELTGEELNIEALQTAFAQARSEMRAEALQNHLDQLIEDGVITQGEADEYLEWWQSKPDISIGSGPRGHGRFRGMGGLYTHP